MSLRMRGLSLIELLFVMALIAVLMVLSMPMLSNANAEARSVVCRQNLASIGDAVAGYARDNNHLPSLVELPPHHAGLSLPELVGSRLQSPDAVYCPSDETERSQLLGTSYRWTAAFNGMSMNQLESVIDMPVLTDRDPYHFGADMPINELVLQRSPSRYRFIVLGTTAEELDEQLEENAGNTSGGNDDKEEKDDKHEPKGYGDEHPGQGDEHRHVHDDEDHNSESVQFGPVHSGKLGRPAN